MAAKRASGIYCGSPMNDEAIKTIVNVIAAGSTIVPTSSIKITNCIEQQNVPQRFGTRTSSRRLWTVEFIQRRRCDRRTRNSSGTVVSQTAEGTKMSFRLVKVLSIRVVRYRSSPFKVNNNSLPKETFDLVYLKI